MRQRACILTTIVMTAACAHAAPGARTPGLEVLTGDELRQAGRTTSTLHEAILALRPLFLQARPGVSAPSGAPARLRVFIDGRDAGSLDELWALRADQVESVRRVQASQAFTLLGTNRTGDGILDITLRRTK